MNSLNISQIPPCPRQSNELKTVDFINCPLFSKEATLDNCIAFVCSSEPLKSYASAQISTDVHNAQKIWDEIEKADNIVILTHKNADGDALGSGMALKNYFNDNYPDKNVQFIVPDGVSSALKGIPGINSVSKIIDLESCRDYLAILVDSDERTVDGLNIYKNASKRINIDHHESNVNLKNTETCDNLTLISPQAPSATEVLYNKLFKPMNKLVSEDVAECLLTGLLTDTGALTYLSEGSNAVETKNSLIEIFDKNKNFTVWTVMDKMDENRKDSPEMDDLFNYLTADKNIKFEISKNGKRVNYIVVSKKLLKDFDVLDTTPDIKNRISRAINDIRENVPIGMVLWETEDGIKVSMRGRDVVVKDFAESYDGGGHAHAAGFNIKAPLDEVVDKVKSDIRNTCFEA